MRNVFHIWITVYIKPEDNEEVVYQNFLKLLPFDLEKDKIKVENTTATGFEERKIKIVQAHLEKESQISKFLKFLNKTLNEDQKRLLRIQKESRLDPENHFFLRIDKEILIKENRFFITDFGNCYHIKMSIAAFPTTRENALLAIDRIFPRKDEKEVDNTA